MELDKIFMLGISLGACKVWTLEITDTPFYTPLIRPLTLFRINILKFLNLPETNQEIDTLIDLIELMKTKPDPEYREKETQGIKNYLIKRIPIWQDRINRELSNIHVTQLSSETSLNPAKLLIGAKSFFKEEIWNSMIDLEKEDLDDACRCISLEAWTPASMITMRVVESVLRAYYKKITSFDLKDWGKILSELKSTSSDDKILLGYLDYLRVIRNKLQHPDARLDQHEAEALFHHALHIINILYSKG